MTLVERGVLEPGLAFIQKSFTAEALARRIREMLAADSRPLFQENRTSPRRCRCGMRLYFVTAGALGSCQPAQKTLVFNEIRDPDQLDPPLPLHCASR